MNNSRDWSDVKVKLSFFFIDWSPISMNIQLPKEANLSRDMFVRVRGTVTDSISHQGT